MALPSHLDALISPLSLKSSDRDVTGVLRAIDKENLADDVRTKAFDRVQRNCHMNRGTFKRLLKRATSKAPA